MPAIKLPADALEDADAHEAEGCVQALAGGIGRGDAGQQRDVTLRLEDGNQSCIQRATDAAAEMLGKDNDKREPIAAYIIHVLLSPIIAGVAAFMVTIVQSRYSPRITRDWFAGPDYLHWVAPVSLISCAIVVWPLRRRPWARIAGMLAAVALAVITNALFYSGAVAKWDRGGARRAGRQGKSWPFPTQ